ncbi:MAG TPA: hypothetical protein VIO61_08415 [Anaerolineaceae bacterium]
MKIRSKQRKTWIPVWVGCLLATLITILPACAADPIVVPTLMIIPTATITETPIPQPTEIPVPEATPTPTLTSSPEGITPEASATPEPSATITPTPTPNNTTTPFDAPSGFARTATHTPRPTPSSPPTNTPTPPPPFLRIQRPGSLSRVVSPLLVEIYSGPGEDGLLHMELIGEDGRKISQQDLNLQEYMGKRLWTNQRLPFEISAVAETARFQIFTKDRAGRMMTLSSVNVILLQVGNNMFNPATPMYEPFMIDTPDNKQEISGGIVILSARVRPVNPSPVIIELVGENGIILASRKVTVTLPPGSQSHTPFVIDLPYSVPAKTTARLIMRQEGDRIPGTVALNSVGITLLP